MRQYFTMKNKYIALVLTWLFTFYQVIADTAGVPFNIGNSNYFLHKVYHKDMSDDSESIKSSYANYAQSMVEKDGKIYIAKNTHSAIESPVIDIYDAITGDYEKSITINSKIDNNFYRKNIYLTKDSNDNLVIFYEPDNSGQRNKGPKFSLQGLDENGTIGPIREFTSSSFYDFSNASGSIIIGDYNEGNFKIYIPVCLSISYGNTDAAYEFAIHNFNVENFNDNMHNRILTQESKAKSTDIWFQTFIGTITPLTDNLLLFDDDGRLPILINTNSPSGVPYQGSLDESIADTGSNGVHAFNYDGNLFIAYGKECSENEMSFGLGVFTDNLEETDNKDYQFSSNSIKPIIELSHNGTITPSPTYKISPLATNEEWNNPYWSNGSGILPVVPFQLSQSRTYTVGGQEVVLLHTYIPGVSLSTYQINKSELMTDISEILSDRVQNTIDNPLVEGRAVTFNNVYPSIGVYDISGKKVAEGVEANSIDLSSLSSGFYIIKNPSASHKIFLR